MDRYDFVLENVKEGIKNKEDMIQEYAILEAIYESLNEKNALNLFPYNWETEYKYNDKIDLLRKAIENKTTINEYLEQNKEISR